MIHERLRVTNMHTYARLDYNIIAVSSWWCYCRIPALEPGKFQLTVSLVWFADRPGFEILYQHFLYMDQRNKMFTSDSARRVGIPPLLSRRKAANLVK